MSKPLDFFQYDQGTLSASKTSLAELAKIYGTPLYVYSEQALLHSFEALKKGLEPLDALICFAVKSNSNLSLLKLLASRGAGMDLVSGGELYRAQMAGVAAERVVFSGVGKTESEMRAGLLYGGRGILSFHVESLAELTSLNALALQMKRRASVSLRFNPDVNPKTHPYIATGLKRNKFGLNQNEILAIARSIRQYPAIEFHGLSIHIGSQLTSLKPLDESFKRLSKLATEVSRILVAASLPPLEWLDVGGGVGIVYKNEKCIPISQYTKLIQKHFLKSGYRILLEPGRVITGNAGVLLTRIISRKVRDRKDFLVVDAGMNDLMRPSLYGSWHGIVPVVQTRGATGSVDVVGPVCESSDCFATDRKLPKRLNAGDLLAITSAGAYGSSMSSQYNTRPRAAEVLVRADGTPQLVRKRETLDDLVRLEMGLEKDSVQTQ